MELENAHLLGFSSSFLYEKEVEIRIKHLNFTNL